MPLEASTRKDCFERKKLHARRYSFCNKPLQTSRDRAIIWSFGNFIACTITMGSKHTSFPKLKIQTSPKVCPWKRQLARSDLRGNDNWIACTMTMGSKRFVPQIEESYPAQSVPMEASTRKERFGRKNLHPRRYSFCNNPLQTSRDRVIIWSFGNLIACTMNMGSKHTLFPKLKSQTPLKVCPWKRRLAGSVLREKNCIHVGTHFLINPFKRSEIV